MPNANFPTVVDRMDVTNDPTSATTTWTTLVDANGKSLVKSFSCHSGRTYELGRTDTGTATVEVENSDGRFDPTNTTSPLNSAGKLLLPMRRYNRQATWNSVTYDVFTGHVERFPQHYDAAGFLGSCSMTCVDALSPLSRVNLRSVYEAEVLADSPVAFYTLNEASGEMSAGSIAASSVGVATVTGTKSAGGSYAFGEDGPSVDVGTALAFTSTGATTQKGYALPLPTAALMQLTSGCVVEMWWKGSTTPPSFENFTLFAQRQKLPINAIAIINLAIGDTSFLDVNVQDALGGPTALATSSATVTNGAWRHFIAVLESDATTLHLYIDGSLDATDAASGAMSNSSATRPIETATMAGVQTPTGIAEVGTGSFAALALYDAPLTAARVLAHYNAGRGWLGDGTGTRVGRLLDQCSWPAAARDIDAGISTVGSYSIAGAKAAQGIGDLAEWEAGNIFIARDGKVTFRQRDARFNAASLATFGDGAGELPYEGDIEFDFDNTAIYNDVQVERAGGASVRVIDDTSQDHYFPSTLAQTIGIDSDAQTVDRANYLLGAYKDPHLRLQTMTIKPSSNTALWPSALGRKIGDRITVKKHGGSAPDISADFFIESVDHNVPGDGTWTTTWQLSPAGSGISDFWVIEDNTFGYIEGSGANVSYPIAF